MPAHEATIVVLLDGADEDEDEDEDEEDDELSKLLVVPVPVADAEAAPAPVPVPVPVAEEAPVADPPAADDEEEAGAVAPHTSGRKANHAGMRGWQISV